MLQLVAVDDADDDVLVGDVGADRQIAHAAAVRDQDAIAGARRQAVDGDHQALSARLAGRRLGRMSSSLRPARPAACRVAQSRPTTRPKIMARPASYRFEALARADFTAAADFFAFALFSGLAAFLGAAAATTGLAARAAFAAARVVPPSAFAATLAAAAPLRPSAAVQHVEQLAVRELAQLGDVVLVLGAVQLLGGRRRPACRDRRPASSAWRPRTAGRAWCWRRRASRLRSSSLLSSPESSTPTILSTSLSLPPNSSFTRASGLIFNASAAAAMGPRFSFVA